MRAHLIVWIDTRQTPPTIISAGVYSEESPSTMLGALRPVSIYSMLFDNNSSTQNFGAIARELRTKVETTMSLAWLRPLMDKSIQIER